MSLNTRIKERREQLGLSRPELADLIGVTPSAIANYENAISSPKVELLYKLFEALKCDANYLYQDEMNSLAFENTPTPEEMEFIKKYRSLDDYGKETINLALMRELERPELNTAHIIPTTSTMKDNMITFSLDSHKLSTWDTSNTSNMSYMFDSVTVLPPYGKLPRTLRKMLDESPNGLWTEAQLSKETSFHYGDTYTYSPINAAHSRTDIEIEESVDTSENHIMDDKDF